MNSRTVVKGKRGGARPGSGPKPYQSTETERNLVLALRGTGLTEEQIASQIGPRGVAVETMKKAFQHELDTGKAKIDGICVTGIVKAMQAGEAWALCFYAKCRMQWRERTAIEVTGPDGGPVQSEHMIRFVEPTPKP